MSSSEFDAVKHMKIGNRAAVNNVAAPGLLFILNAKNIMMLKQELQLADQHTRNGTVMDNIAIGVDRIHRLQ